MSRSDRHGNALGMRPAKAAIRAGDGGLAPKARVLGRLAAQGTHVPGGLAGLALLVEPVARALAAEVGGQHMPPELGGAVEAHLLDARIGQAIAPVVETGESGPDHPHQGLSG